MTDETQYQMELTSEEINLGIYHHSPYLSPRVRGQQREQKLNIKLGASSNGEQIQKLLKLWFEIAITHKSVLKVTKDDLMAANSISQHFVLTSSGSSSRGSSSYSFDSHYSIIARIIEESRKMESKEEELEEEEDDDLTKFGTPPSKRSNSSVSLPKDEPSIVGECSKNITKAADDESSNSGEDELAMELIYDFLMTLHFEIVLRILMRPEDHLPLKYLPIFSHLLKITEEASQSTHYLTSNGILLERDTLIPYGISSWENEAECVICFEIRGMFKRECCGINVCERCFTNYLSTNIKEQGRISFLCPNSGCGKALHTNEIIFRLDNEVRQKFDTYSANACRDPRKKTCPRCNHIHKFTIEEEERAKIEQDSAKSKSQNIGLNVTCPTCELVWCFHCYTPDHRGMTCKEYKIGDKKLKEWANQIIQNAYKARPCPKCKILIERAEGCPHMNCSQCNVEWCYDCGRRYRSFFLLGSHSKRFSVFGCKDILCRDNKHARRFIRGSILTLKLLGIAATGGLGVGAYFAIKKIRENCWRCC